MTDNARVSLSARLAARAVTLSLDAATAPEDVADHLLHLARRDPVVLARAAVQVERRHHHPGSAGAQLAVRALRMAAALAAEAVTAPTDRAQGAVA